MSDQTINFFNDNLRRICAGLAGAIPRSERQGHHLVLWGPFRSGKTRFALSDIFGSNPLKVDVGDSEDLNIQAWDHRVHSHLVLDNVNCSAYIMRWRHVLMGPPEAVQLGQSGTGMYVSGANL